MLTFVGRRLLQLIPTLFFVSVIIFSLQHLLPGDPALVMAGEERDPAAIEQIRQHYHLDRPLPVQYVYWVKAALSGDLGESMRLKEPVLSLIVKKLPVTITLASMAIVIALTIGIGAGIISAVKKDSIWDYAANVFALWGISTPNFWLGIMLIFLFSVKLGWLPGVRLRAAHRGLANKPCHDDHAGFRARQRDCRDPDAAYTQRDAARSRKRLYPHGARQRAP
jgi:peptide/nickel transport system permease protein